MASASQFYLDHIYAVSSGYRATWDPDLPVRVGDLVKIDDYGVVNIQGSLTDKGIQPDVRISTTAMGLDYSSQRGIQVNIKAAGTVPVTGALTNADAGFNIQFGSDKGVIFKLNGYKTQVIANLGDIEAKVLALYRNQAWPDDLLIITNLITADTSTIIISDKGSASLDLKAKANINVADLDLTNASLGLSTVQKTGSIVQFVATQGISPLYKVMGLRCSFLGMGSKHLDTRSLDAEKPEEQSIGLTLVEPEQFDF